MSDLSFDVQCFAGRDDIFDPFAVFLHRGEIGIAWTAREIPRSLSYGLRCRDAGESLPRRIDGNVTTVSVSNGNRNGRMIYKRSKLRFQFGALSHDPMQIREALHDDANANQS